MDPRCSFGGYVSCRYRSAVYVLAAIYMSGQIMSKRRTATLENCKQILGCSLQVFLPVYFFCFQDRFYKVLHLSLYSNLVLWGEICYTIFSHWSCHLDTEPALSLVTLTPCLFVTPFHLYGTSLTYDFPLGRSYL